AGVRIDLLAHGVIGKQKLPERFAEEGLSRLHGHIAETRGLGISIGIERGIDAVAPGPEARAADLVRVGFLHYRIRQARDFSHEGRSAPTRKTRYREIKAAPKEMHRAAFSDEAGAKLLQHAVHLQQHAPEAVGVVRIVGGMLVIPVEWNGPGNFAGIDRNS